MPAVEHDHRHYSLYITSINNFNSLNEKTIKRSIAGGL